MTIYSTLLARGYFPKELPPAFFTRQFADYATSRAGRAALKKYKPRDNLTFCGTYRLALPGHEHRQLAIPHPQAYAKIAELCAKSFKRLLTKAAKSPFSKSRPVYASDQSRALRPLVKPQNLNRERLLARAGCSSTEGRYQPVLSSTIHTRSRLGHRR